MKGDATMDVGKARSEFCLEFNLKAERRKTELKEPAQHQKDALRKLQKWYETGEQPSGALLVLPTGGGKTFTAQRFMCGGPISDGYKVLWLAHTHHLLEQSLTSLNDSVHRVAEPREKLIARVVSGTIGHFKPRDIKPTDDVLIATLQTAYSAHERKHPGWETFLQSAEGRLFVLFDEAHHSPAYTYRKLIQALREKCEDMHSWYDSHAHVHG